jgi:hypothetical protein
MKENILNKGYLGLFVICLLLSMAGCKAKKQLVAKKAAADTSVAKPIDNKKAQLDAIRAGQTSFNTFSGKARAALNISGSSNDVTLTIRIKRDEKIWVSVTAIAGIEVARAVITPDSLLVINRLQSLYLKKPFSYINKFAGNQVNYKTIESLLIGNAIPELINEDAALQAHGDSIILSGNLQTLDYKLVIGQGMKAVKTNLNDQSAGQSMQAINSIFIQSGLRLIPSQIDITSLVKEKKIQVNLHYVKSDFDQPVEFPFSIPTRYKEGN